MLNQQLSFFAESWNHHQIQSRHGPNRSPMDMFGFDMLVHGVRGDELPQDETLTDEDLEAYGIDWAALRDEHVLQSVRECNSSEGSTSWVGQTGPPAHLNEVPLEAPIMTETFNTAELDQEMNRWAGLQGEDVSISSIWVHSLAVARTIYYNLF
jgi:hypothetical protein